jgi:hypothetical protein
MAETADSAIRRAASPSRPWLHWALAVAALVWNLAGAFTIQAAQLGRLPGLTPDETAYYAEKPAVLVVITGIATYGSVLASILLLMRRRQATWAFAVALAGIVLGNAIELATGSSRITESDGAAIGTALIVLIAVALLLYARTSSRRGLLR